MKKLNETREIKETSRPGVLKLDGVRLAYASLDAPTQPKGYDQVTPKYGAIFWIKKNDIENITKLKDELVRIGAGNVDEKMWALIDGDTPAIDITRVPGYCILSAKNVKQPKLVDQNVQEIKDNEEIKKTFYKGCYVNITVNLWVYKPNKVDFTNARVVAKLLGVQFAYNGKSLNPEVSDADDFDKVTEETRNKLIAKIEACDKSYVDTKIKELIEDSSN